MVRIFILFFAVSIYSECLYSQQIFNNGNYFELGDTNKWGLKNPNQEWIIEPIFENEKIEIQNNYSIVKYKKRFGIIDENGNWIIEAIYEGIHRGRDSSFWEIYNDNSHGLILPDWKIIKPKYTGIITHRNIAEVHIAGKAGFIFVNGKIIEPYLHLGVGASYGGDNYHFQSINGKWGIVFDDGLVIEPNFDEIISYNKDRTIFSVKNDDKYIFVNSEGKPISGFKFDRIRDSFDENGFCLVVKDDKYGYMRDDGFLIKPIYEGISKFANGEATVWLLDDRKAKIDMDGNLLTPYNEETEEFYTNNNDLSKDVYTSNSDKNSYTSKYTEQNHRNGDNSTSTDVQQDNNSVNMNEILFWIIVISVIIILIACLIYGHNRKCNSCGKWYAMKTTDKVCTGSVATTVIKKEETKNRNGEVIATRNVHVPATRYHYDVYRECKHCSYRDVVGTHETYEN